MIGGYGKMVKAKEGLSFVFIHVPRTAGTTFKKMLKNCGYRGKGDNRELDNLRGMFTGRKVLNPFDHAFSLKVYQRDKRLIHGHTPLAKYYPMLKESHKFITWVRDPVDRMISQYQWWIARGWGRAADVGGIYRNQVLQGRLSLVELCRKMPNTYRVMLGDDLSVFDWIGVQEDFKGSLERFSDTFGITIPEYKSWNVRGTGYKVKRKIRLSDEKREEMRKYLRSDYKVYEEALKICKK